MLVSTTTAIKYAALINEPLG